jgi:Fic family protein
VLVLYPGLSRRTAQRQIGQLVASGKLVVQGAGRARRYCPVYVASVSADGLAFPDFIPLSPDSRDILAYVEQTPAAKKPVGYQAEFLRAYQPNQSHYLPAALRRQLRRIGETPEIGAPVGTYSRAILNRLLIDLSWASSHLEGNTYTRLDTRALLEQGKVAQGKAAIETQMILNHKAAIEFLVDNIDNAGFNRYTLMNLHGVLAENLLPNPADEGRLRQHGVDITQSVFRPLDTPQQIDELFDTLLAKASRIDDPFEQSFFVLAHLPYLQAFADINKRTARLAANLPLFRANLCPLTFLDVPERAYALAMLGVYEMTRVELLRDLYVWAYERSAQEYLVIRKTLAEPDPLRLAWRDLIRESVRAVVLQPKQDAIALVEAILGAEAISASECDAIKAQIMEELRRLHEGVLARYGLRPSDLALWKAKQI